MQCKCGGSTIDREVVRDKTKAGELAECTACGRIFWRYQTEALKRELDHAN